jgi:hypothetical protein
VGDMDISIETLDWKSRVDPIYQSIDD